jgi:type IV pilus assembly protein PilY1
MREFAFVVILTVFIFSSAIPLHADDTVLFTANVAPDALIMLDLSGSMGQNPGGEYNYQSSYVANEDDPCTDAATWGTSGAGHTYRCAAVEGQIWGDSACNGPFYTSSGGSHSADCSKLAIAKRAIFDLLDDNNDGQLKRGDEESLNVRFGYMRFIQCTVEDPTVDYNSGCNTLRRGFGFDYDKLYDKYIKNEDNMYWTALASQLKEGKKYLDDHKTGDTAAECRKKFLILVTDGWDTVACGHDRNIGDEYVTGSFSYMRRRATVAAVKEAIDAGYSVFAVGFGADMPLTERNTLNWVALKGGTDNLTEENSGDPNAITDLIFSSNPCEKYVGCSPHQHDCTNAPNDPGYANLSGYAFLAQDATTLGKSLQTIFKWIREKAFSFTAPTVPSVRLTDTESVYISSFAPNTTPFWRGDLKAYTLNTNGTLPVDENGFPSQSPVWEASALLGSTNPNGRTIYTVKSGSRVDFTEANLTDTDLGISTSTSCNTGCQDLIKHVRGFDPYDIDGDTDLTESRKFKLGDIFHSQAVIVGAPSSFFMDDGYSGAGGFYNTKKNRTKVILAGANDGMLHAFDAATGAEKWAFIPPSLLTTLKTMKTNWDTYKATGASADHLYYVDASPRVSDVWFYSSSVDTSKSVDEWRTVLINGLRKGGKTYFALDITDTNNPVYLWEFPKSTDAATLALVGESWSDPTIGRVKIEVGNELYERWVAFIGGGCDPAERRKETWEGVNGRAFFVVDIKTGEILWQFKYDILDAEKRYMIHSLASPATAVDSNSDGYVDKVYMGDLGGQVWVFDLSFDAIAKKSDSLWSGKRLFKAPGLLSEKHNIYYQVTVAFDKNEIPWVFFGTGDRENPIEGGTERFYAVKDDGLGDYPRDEGNLENVTNNNTFTAPVHPKKGWYIRLTNRKEQALAKPVVFNNIVYFTTFSPKEEDWDVCTTGGTARLYVMEYRSGGGALEVDAMTDLEGSAGTRWKIVGSGLPSAPAITINSKGQAAIIAGTTENQVYSQLGFSPGSNKRVLYWRQVHHQK